MPESLSSWLESIPTPLAVMAVGSVVALVVVVAVEQFVRFVGRGGRRPGFRLIFFRARWPWRFFAAALVFASGIAALEDGARWQRPLEILARVVVVAAVAWMAVAMARVMEELIARRLPLDRNDNRRARRAKTQLAMVRRIAQVLIVGLAVVVLIASWPEGRTLGASLLASAGLVGLVAGLAAQSTLSNIVAGLQLTFTDALRLDDVVVVEGEWGKIEEITLTYIVVAVWDDRRLVLPSSYFVSNPFQHWTRTQSHLIGAVVMRFDYTLDVAAMRAELERYLADSEWWDGRGWALQVIDDDGATVHVRAIATAVDGPQAWELRCAIREHLLAWVRDTQPTALPRHRLVAADELDRLVGVDVESSPRIGQDGLGYGPGSGRSSDLLSVRLGKTEQLPIVESDGEP